MGTAMLTGLTKRTATAIGDRNAGRDTNAFRTATATADDEAIGGLSNDNSNRDAAGGIANAAGQPQRRRERQGRKGWQGRRRAPRRLGQRRRRRRSWRWQRKRPRRGV